MLKEMSVEQLMEIVKTSTTDDNRIAPDYANSYQLYEVIQELAERAWMYEETCY